LSGWKDRPDGYEFASPREVKEYSDTIGHPARPHHARDHVNTSGFEGAAYYSHAEKQMAVRHPNEPFGVSRSMCTDCQDFFKRHAYYQGKPQTVTDPDGTWQFPGGEGPPLFTSHP